MSRRAPGPRGGDGVGRLHDHRFERRPVDVHVVRGHRHHDRFALAVLAEEVDADLQVRALHLAIDRLADVVHERGADGDVGVEADLPRHDAGEARDFGRVIEHVLPVAGAVLQPAHQPQDLRDGDRGGRARRRPRRPSLRIASSVSSLTFCTTSSMRAG